MFKFSKLKIRHKLPIFLVVFALMGSASLVTVSSINVQRNAWTTVQNKFEAVIADRSTAVQSLVAAILSDAETLATVPSTGTALQRMGSAWNALGDERVDFLRTTFIDENPNSPEERMKLDRGAKTVPYNIHHSGFHPGFRSVMLSKGYSDIYLLNIAGDVIYSVSKRDDYARNLLAPGTETALSRFAAGLLEAEPGTVLMSDLETYSAAGNAPMIFAGTKVVSKEQVVGSLIIAAPGALLNAIVAKGDGLGARTEVYLVGEDGQARTASRHEGGHGTRSDLPALPYLADAFGGTGGFVTDTAGLSAESVVALAQPLTFGSHQWVIAAEENRQDVLQPVRRDRNLLLLTSLIGAVIMSIVGWFYARAFTRPIESLNKSIEAVRSGDLGATIETANRGDELGHMGKSLSALTEELRNGRAAEEARRKDQETQEVVVEQLSTGLSHLSKGDLTFQLDAPFPEEHEKLRVNFNEAVSRLAALVEDVALSTDSIRSGSNEISQAAGDLAQRTESQAATLEQTAAALDEITSSVSSAADGARSVENIVKEARDQAENSDSVVRQAVTAMSEIEGSSDKISQIIGVIDDIAFQTNLLALNAGVEAARAGDAGRGFAVVASEVRGLAQRSSDAAKEIKNLINESTSQVSRGVSLVDDTGTALASILERVTHISALVSEIAEGAEQQSQGLSEINTGMTQLDQVTQQNAAMVEEATAASHILLQDADKMGGLMAQFTIAAPSSSPTSARPSAAPSAHGHSDFLSGFEGNPAEASDPAGFTPQDHPQTPAPEIMSEGSAAKAIWKDF